MLGGRGTLCRRIKTRSVYVYMRKRDRHSIEPMCDTCVTLLELMIWVTCRFCVCLRLYRWDCLFDTRPYSSIEKLTVSQRVRAMPCRERCR